MSRDVTYEALHTPGVVFELPGMGDFHTFETDIAPLVDPRARMDAWAGRLPLGSEMLRGAGRLPVVGVSLEVMDNPLRQLIDDRLVPPGLKEGTRALDERVGAMVGLDYRLRLGLNGGTGNVGGVSGRVWYAPLSRDSLSARPKDPSARGLIRVHKQLEVTGIAAPRRGVSPRVGAVSPGSRGRAYVLRRRHHYEVLGDGSR